MYAVIVAGGKQQRVAVDDVIRVEKIESADGVPANSILREFVGPKKK